MQILRAANWGFSYGEACYYGRRYWLHIGLLHILWGQMSEADYNAWADANWPSRNQI